MDSNLFDLNKLNSKRYSPLSLSLENNNLTIANMLLERSVKIYNKDLVKAKEVKYNKIDRRLEIISKTKNSV